MIGQTQNTHDLDQLWEIVKDIHIAMLTTREEDGALRARPMATQKPSQDGYLWFVTRLDSPKSTEIENDHEVQVSYADSGKSSFVSVSGTAVILQDREKINELWNPLMNAWFEQGKDDPEAALVRVTIKSAEYWSGPSNKLVRLFGVAKAAVTGHYDQGEHGKVELP